MAQPSAWQTPDFKAWQAGLIAAGFGALGVLAHAPFHFWPAMAISLCGLVVLLDGADRKSKRLRAGFFRAWAWAFGYFLAGMFWVANAFLVDAEKFAALIPFAVSALPAGLGLFWGFGGLLAMLLWKPGAGRIVTFALAFGLAEIARGHLLTGLPWNLPAYIWEPGKAMSQTGALIGPYGVSLLTILVLASPAVLLSNATHKAKLATLGLSVLVFASAFGYGTLRLSGPKPVEAGPLIAAGQAGFTQKEVWDPSNTPAVTQGYLDLLTSPEAQNTDLIVWPEGAFPFLLMENDEVLRAIEARLGDRTLAVGTVRRDLTPQGERYFNSLTSFSTREGGLSQHGIYDKHHLVPFGEYLPFRPVFQALGIASLVAYDGEMTPSPAPGLFSMPGLPIADPRICYEIVFPGFNPKAQGQATFILNVSIDAWYGDLLGPDQHFAQARWRAIETGMPVVRAASGGWSAIVDSFGQIKDSHQSGPGYAVARLPSSLGPTPYARWGEASFALLALFFAFFAIFRRFFG